MLTGDPSSNGQLSWATEQACAANEAAPACELSVLADINAARAGEGVGPMTLPSGYDSLSVPEQLLVLANLERIGRGLSPAAGLSGTLNTIAAVAAAADLDPDPPLLTGDALTANWAGGTASPLVADFLWMYDDGLGSGNIDCTVSDPSGCWGHRHDILFPFDAPLVMGAAYAPSTLDGPSLAELFVGRRYGNGRGRRRRIARADVGDDLPVASARSLGDFSRPRARRRIGHARGQRARHERGGQRVDHQRRRQLAGLTVELRAGRGIEL